MHSLPCFNLVDSPKWLVRYCVQISSWAVAKQVIESIYWFDSCIRSHNSILCSRIHLQILWHDKAHWCHVLADHTLMLCVCVCGWHKECRPIYYACKIGIDWFQSFFFARDDANFEWFIHKCDTKPQYWSELIDTQWKSKKKKYREQNVFAQIKTSSKKMHTHGYDWNDIHLNAYKYIQ